MKKKLISGLFVVLFIGNISFFTVSEAIENQENDWMNPVEIGRGYKHHRAGMNEERSESKQNEGAVESMSEEAEVQKKWQESKGHRRSRGENSYRNHMDKTNRRHKDRMTDSCW